MPTSLSIGVDIGGTNTKIGVVDENGAILLQHKTATDSHQGCHAIAASIVGSIDSMLKEAGIRREQITGIGVGVPGTADSDKGAVVYAPNLAWRNVPIVAAIRRLFPVPVYIAQDTRAAAWAEYMVGSERGLRSIAAVTLGTGIGCGMVLDGAIFHGGLNTAGEFGHQIVQLNGECCNCGRRGCLEAYAGGLAIVREAKKRIPNIGVQLKKNASAVTVADVYQLAGQGNPDALRLAQQVVQYIGIGLVNLINLNSIEAVCISGGISSAPAPLLLDPLLEFVRARVYQEIAGKVRLCRSTLGEDAPLIGASLLYRAAN